MPAAVSERRADIFVDYTLLASLLFLVAISFRCCRYCARPAGTNCGAPPSHSGRLFAHKRITGPFSPALWTPPRWLITEEALYTNVV